MPNRSIFYGPEKRPAPGSFDFTQAAWFSHGEETGLEGTLSDPSTHRWLWCSAICSRYSKVRKRSPSTCFPKDGQAARQKPTRAPGQHLHHASRARWIDAPKACVPPNAWRERQKWMGPRGVFDQKVQGLALNRGFNNCDDRCRQVCAVGSGTPEYTPDGLPHGGQSVVDKGATTCRSV
jgi:hypothetical protein